MSRARLVLARTRRSVSVLLSGKIVGTRQLFRLLSSAGVRVSRVRTLFAPCIPRRSTAGTLTERPPRVYDERLGSSGDHAPLARDALSPVRSDAGHRAVSVSAPGLLARGETTKAQYLGGDARGQIARNLEPLEGSPLVARESHEAGVSGGWSTPADQLRLRSPGIRRRE